MRKTIGLILGLGLVAGLMLVSLVQAAPGGGGLTPTAWVYLPFVALYPTPTVTNTPTPTITPTRTPTPTITATLPPQGNLSGDLSLVSNQATYATYGEWVKFYELIHNTTSSNIYYGILGVNVTGPVNLPFKTSWDGAGAPGGVLTIGPGCYGPGGGSCAPNPEAGRSEDHVGDDWADHTPWEITTPGQYTITLHACVSPYAACTSGGGVWQQIGNSVQFTAIHWTPQAPNALTPTPPPYTEKLCYLITSDPQHVYLDCDD